MRKRMTKVMAGILMAALSIQLAACGGDGWNEDKAEKYVEAALSLYCTGENSTGMEFDGLSDEEAAEERENLIDEWVQVTGTGLNGVSDDALQQFKDVVDKAMSNASYDIGEAKKTDDGYEVPVTIHPIMIFAGVDMDDIQYQIAEMAVEGEIDVNDEAAVYDTTLEMVSEAMDTSLENPVYGDDYDMTVEITKDDDGNYSVPESSMEEFGQYLFALDS